MRLSPRLLGLPAALLLCAAALPAAAAPAAITWTPRGAFAGREFTSILSPPGYPCAIAFTALNNGGLYESTDCGVQFAPLIATNAYGATARDTNVGYLAAGTSGVLKTVDGGAFWFPVNAGLPVGHDARAIAIDIAHPDTVVAGLYNGGVFIGGPSADTLVAWTSLNAGLGDLRVRAVARTRGGTFLLAATDGGVWRLEDGAWSLSGPGFEAWRVFIDGADSSRVYAAGPGGVYRSTDEGRSFTLSSTGLPGGIAVNDIVRRSDRAAVLYAGLRGAGVYESVDYGASWHPFGPPVPGENDVRALLAVVDEGSSTASIFAGTRTDGLFEANYSTPAVATTWGGLKGRYR